MKKYIIVIIILIITFIILIKNINIETKETIYSITTNNYINNELYSTTIEEISLINNKYSYKKETKYQKSSQLITIEKNGKYKTKSNKIIFDNDKELVIEDNNLCIDTLCENKYSLNNTKKDNYIEYDEENYYKYINNIEDNINSTGYTFIVVSSSGCSHCASLEKSFKEILKEYSLTILNIDIQKISIPYKKEILEKYEITGTPTTLVFKDGTLNQKIVGDKSKQELANLLFEINIPSR